MNTTSTSSQSTPYAEFYYEHNKQKINIHTNTDLSNVLVSFNINGKIISTYIRSLSTIFDILIKIDINFILNYIYQINNNLKNIVNNINNLLYDNKIDINDLNEFYDNKIYVRIIYNYRFSKESFHGYTNIYLENFIDSTIINLSNYDKNINVYLQSENVVKYKTTLKNLIFILESKRDGKKCITNDNEIKNNQNNNIKLKLFEDINNNNIYELFIYSSKF